MLPACCSAVVHLLLNCWLCWQGHTEVTEEDVFAAIEYGALVQQDELMDANILNDPVPDPIPMTLRKSIAVYQAGKALLGYITPDFEKIGRVRGRGQGPESRAGAVPAARAVCWA